ncbi:nucleotide exchange factor SIL1 isoform X2 [Salminus brasiliensis]|uniref:nucleotide exchange factor SIL1 isoform X2 n=1 Tax=Salminus brasiliensis TaxID=930266 RepID=UPI003B835A97
MLMQFPTALTIKEDEFNKEKVYDTHKTQDSGELEVFYPTNEWQTLKPGQAVPAGLHVRLNLQTGQREAKLGEEEGVKYWTHKQRPKMNKQSVLFTTKKLIQALKKFKGGTDDPLKIISGQAEESQSSPFYPVDNLKRDMKMINFLVETDVQIMRKLLSQFNSTSSTVDQRVTALLELEYLVHQVDNAQNLLSMGGMKLVIDALNSTDVRLQESAAFVLGSAASSNPLVQDQALEGGALQKLFTLLAASHPVSVKKKALFALACLLHHVPFAQSHFVKIGGVQVLGELFQEQGADNLRVRIITMLYDMITEKELILQTGIDAVPNSSHQEYLQQYNEVSLQPILAEQGWCSLVPELLGSPEHDGREKALRTLLAMMPHCQTQYQQNPTLITSLSTLQKEYRKHFLTEETLGEKDGYFGEILALLDSLIMKTH